MRSVRSSVRPFALLLHVVFAAAAAGAAAQPIAEPPTGAGDLVIRYSQGFGEAATDERTSIEVWGDGRVVVRRPAFVKGAKQAQWNIGQAQVAALLQSIASEGVLDFDAAEVKAELKAADVARAEAARQSPGEVMLLHASDPDPSTLEVHAARWLPDGEGGPVQVDVVRVIDWLGVRADARRHPQLASIAGLDRAQRSVTALLALPGLR